MLRLSGILSLVAIASAITVRAASETGWSGYEATTLVAQSQPRWGDTVWVANRDANTITIVEAATGVTIRTMAIGSGPHDIVIAPLTGKAYVMSELDDRVVVLSASTLQVLGSIAVPRPHHAELSEDGRAVLIGLFNSNQIAVIDTVTNAVRIHATSGNAALRAHAPRSSRDSRFIFVPHEVGEDVTALDAQSGAIVGGVRAGSQPSEVLPSPDGRRLFVSMRGEGTVKLFNLATGQLAGTATVGTQPETMILTPDQRTLVVTLRGSPAALALVDVETMTLVGTVPLAGSGTFGDLAVASPDGRRIYATFDAGVSGIGGVVAFDAQSGQRLLSWTYPGTGRPHGIAYSTVPITVP
jgi:DNA-binding beta-propeller fold protein YncE